MSLPHYLVLESLKFPDNKTFRVCTVVSTACEVAARLIEISKYHEHGFDSTFDELASLIRKQGSTWILAMRIAAFRGTFHGRDETDFAKLYDYIESKNLQKIYSLKPLIDGKEIMTAFKLEKQGPVVGKINQNMFLWQAKNQEKSKEMLLAEIESNPTQFTV